MVGAAARDSRVITPPASTIQSLLAVVSPNIRLALVRSPFRKTVEFTVMSSVEKLAVSPDRGIPLGDQLTAVSQRPEASPARIFVQVYWVWEYAESAPKVRKQTNV